MHDDESIISSIPIPSSLETEDLSIKLKTDYPFENRFEYTVESKKDFALKIRVPSFAKNLTVNGTAVTFCEELRFDIKAGEKANLTVFDLEKEYKIDTNEFLSMGKATPFEGDSVFGRCMLTIYKGDIAWKENLTEN
jgi:hypothetical protein